MLKKAGTAVVIAAAGVLALAPFALADEGDDGDRTIQNSTEGEGEFSDGDIGSGFSEQLLCNEVIGDGEPDEGTCTNTSTAESQEEEQNEFNG